MNTEKIRFSTTPPSGDRLHCLTPDDIRTVLSRLPSELWSTLRTVHFNDRGRARVLGYVTSAKREIAICAVAPRFSLSGAVLRGQSPRHFGAIRGWQWPRLAVRRFMLYDTFLHELGHLQLVRPNAKSKRLRYAREKLAEDFAALWRQRLWATPFEHADPVHNPPSPEELAHLDSLPPTLSKQDKDLKLLEHTVRFSPATSDIHVDLGMEYMKRKRFDDAERELRRAAELNPSDGSIWIYLGQCAQQQKQYETATAQYQTAQRLMPASADPWLSLALLKKATGDFQAADDCVRRAHALEPDNPFVKRYLAWWAKFLASRGGIEPAE
jgi:tetratricopeptide (TPR) repeat protein